MKTEKYNMKSRLFLASYIFQFTLWTFLQVVIEMPKNEICFFSKISCNSQLSKKTPLKNYSAQIILNLTPI